MVSISENAKFSVITVNPEFATYASNDVVLTVTGGVVDAIKIGGNTVNSNNYTVVGDKVTLLSSYLNTLASGAKKFYLFSGEQNTVFELTIN